MAFRGPQEEAQARANTGPNTGNPGGAYNMESLGGVQFKPGQSMGDQMTWLQQYFRNQQAARGQGQQAPQTPNLTLPGTSPMDYPSSENVNMGPQVGKVPMGQPNQVQPDGSVPKPGNSFVPTNPMMGAPQPPASPNKFVPPGPDGGPSPLPAPGGGLPPYDPNGERRAQRPPFDPEELRRRLVGRSQDNGGALGPNGYPGAPRYTPPIMDDNGNVTNSHLQNFNLPRHWNQATANPMGGGNIDIQALIDRLLSRGGY